MKRRLSNSQRQAIQKTVCLIFAIVLFLGVLTALPYLASLVPKFSSSSARDLLKDAQITPQKTPDYYFSSGGEPQKSNKIETMEQSTNQDTESQPDVDTETPPPQPQEGDLPVMSDNLCWYEVGEDATLDIINRTDYNVNLNDYINRAFPITGAIGDAPLVLIVHTHGSESFLPREGVHSDCDADCYCNYRLDITVHTD